MKETDFLELLCQDYTAQELYEKLIDHRGRQDEMTSFLLDATAWAETIAKAIDILTKQELELEGGANENG
jgi:hypothetical protein